MACFLVPAAEAIVTTILKKKADKNHKESDEQNIFIEKMGWLNNMLWGGSALLAFEHIWHGELTPFFPFLTNAANPADRLEMFFEMSTTGVAMAVFVTVFWVCMVVAARKIEKMPEAVKSVRR